MEVEDNNQLAFIGINVLRQSNYFSTSVFRKTTFSGLGSSFFSYCCRTFKTNSIQTLLHRGYTICSSALSFHREVVFLRNFFHNNGFPTKLFNDQLEKFLSKKHDFQPVISSVAKKSLYFVLPYYGHKSVLLIKELTNLITEYFPHIEPKLILTNQHKIGSYLSYKDKIPKILQSGIVYKFSCPQNCGSAYIGSSIRTLQTRVMEHAGLSVRTQRPLTSPLQSAVRSHCVGCGGVPVLLDNFEVINYRSGIIDLRILESLYIMKEKPNLNQTDSAFPLKILK